MIARAASIVISVSDRLVLHLRSVYDKLKLRSEIKLCAAQPQILCLCCNLISQKTHHFLDTNAHTLLSRMLIFLTSSLTKFFSAFTAFTGDTVINLKTVRELETMLRTTSAICTTVSQMIINHGINKQGLKDTTRVCL